MTGMAFGPTVETATVAFDLRRIMMPVASIPPDFQPLTGIRRTFAGPALSMPRKRARM
jgi:hypothetical protein